jgi:DNA polymerase III psi subunit
MKPTINYYNIPNFKLVEESITGNNKKGILVVTGTLSEENHIALLSKILKSIHVTFPSDVLLLKAEVDERYHLGAIHEDEKLTHIVSFGISPGQLGLNIPDNPFGVYKLEKITLIKGPSLEGLSQSAQLKKQLWRQLKTEFIR